MSNFKYLVRFFNSPSLAFYKIKIPVTTALNLIPKKNLLSKTFLYLQHSLNYQMPKTKIMDFLKFLNRIIAGFLSLLGIKNTNPETARIEDDNINEPELSLVTVKVSAVTNPSYEETFNIHKFELIQDNDSDFTSLVIIIDESVPTEPLDVHPTWLTNNIASRYTYEPPTPSVFTDVSPGTYTGQYSFNGNTGVDVQVVVVPVQG